METETQTDSDKQANLMKLNACKKHGVAEMDVRVTHDGMVSATMLVPFCKVCKKEDDERQAKMFIWKINLV